MMSDVLKKQTTLFDNKVRSWPMCKINSEMARKQSKLVFVPVNRLFNE